MVHNRSTYMNHGCRCELCREAAKRWYQENGERLRAYQRRYDQDRRAERVEYNRMWRKTERGRSLIRKHKELRRGLLLAPEDDEYITILENDPCAYCGE